MYFLIASGLSLIYGLMGVLNFAHGAFITVGCYATWWMSENVFDGVGSSWLRFLVSALCGLVAGGDLRRARGARPDQAALPAPHRAGARHRRPVDRVRRARPGHLGPGRSARTRRRRWLHETTTLLGAHIPNDRWVEIATAVVVLVAAPALPAADALRADHPRRRREPRDGDGARHRRAQGVHARVRDRRNRGRARRRAQRRLLHDDRSRPGDEPADLRVHRRRDRRPRLDRRLGDRRGRRRPRPAVRELLRVELDRRHGGRAPARCSCCSRPCCSCARAASRERSRREQATSSRTSSGRSPSSARSRSCRRSAGTIPKLFDSAISSPGTLQLLALCLLFGGARAHVRPALRLHRAAVVRARALRRDRRVHGEHRDHRLALELRAGAALHGAARASSCRSSSARLAARRAASRSRW